MTMPIIHIHPSIHHPRYSSNVSVAAKLFHPAGSSNGRMTRPEFCRSDENPTATPDTLTAPSTTRAPPPARSPVLQAPHIAAPSGHYPPLHRVRPPSHRPKNPAPTPPTRPSAGPLQGVPNGKINLNGMTNRKLRSPVGGSIQTGPALRPGPSSFPPSALSLFYLSHSYVCLALICKSYFGLSRSEGAPTFFIRPQHPPGILINLAHHSSLTNLWAAMRRRGCLSSLEGGIICVAFETWRHLNPSNAYLRIVSRTITL